MGKAISADFSLSEINYGAYADMFLHLHMHVVPNYHDGYGFGGVLEMNPEKTFLSDTEYTDMVEIIKVELSK